MWWRSPRQRATTGVGYGVSCFSLLPAIEAVLCNIICLGAVEVGFASWGGIEIWKNSCDDLKDTSLWEFALVTFSMQVVFGVLFLIIVPIYICGNACCNTTSN